MARDVRQMVEQCRLGEPTGVGRLVQHFRGRVFALCYRMLGQWQDAEDAVQETFVRMVRSLPRWDAERAFEPWLMAIAANRCRSAIQRRRRRVNTQPLDWSEPPPSVDSHDANLHALREELEEALADLPTSWATALRLFHEEGLAYQEIAQRMGCPLGTVKTWVHRGRRELLARLQRRQVLPVPPDLD